MITTLLSRLLNKWCTWPDGRTPGRLSPVMKFRGLRTGFFRPQLLVLEDRCLLSTASVPLTETFLVHRGINGILSAQLQSASVATTQNQAVGTHVIVILAEDSQATAKRLDGTFYQAAVPGDITLIIKVPDHLAESTPALLAPGTVFILVFGSTATTNQPSGSIIVVSTNQNPANEPVLIIMQSPQAATSPYYGSLVYVSSTNGSIDIGVSNMPSQSPAPPTQISPQVPTVPLPLPPGHPTPGAPVGSLPLQNRNASWWSQTPHPISGPVVVLVSPYGALGSVPEAQASAPVVLFLSSQVSHATNDNSSQVNGSFLLPHLVEQLVALEVTSIFLTNWGASVSRLDADCYLPIVNFDPALAFDEQLAEPEPQNEDESAGKRTPAPTRAQLLALTDRILQEDSQSTESPDPRGRVFSLHTVIVCAAVQSAWLGLRHLASKRIHQTRQEGGEPLSWAWQRSRR